MAPQPEQTAGDTTWLAIDNDAAWRVEGGRMNNRGPTIRLAATSDRIGPDLVLHAYLTPSQARNLAWGILDTLGELEHLLRSGGDFPYLTDGDGA